MRFADLECRYERPGHCLHCIPAMRDALRGMPVPLQAAGALSSLVELGWRGAQFKRGSCADHESSESAPHDRPRTKDQGLRTKDAAQPQTKDAMRSERTFQARLIDDS
jgi:hypothetical protein